MFLSVFIFPECLLPTSPSLHCQGYAIPACLDSMGSGKKQDEMPTRVSVAHDSATQRSCQKGQDDPGPRNRNRHNSSMRSSSPYIGLCPDTLDILPQGVSGNLGRIQREPHIQYLKKLSRNRFHINPAISCTIPLCGRCSQNSKHGM